MRTRVDRREEECREQFRQGKHWKAIVTACYASARDANERTCFHGAADPSNEALVASSRPMHLPSTSPARPSFQHTT